MSFDESRGVYHCHGAGCDFSGGAAKLARELGLAEPLAAAEYGELRRERERADRAAGALYDAVKARRFELLECLHSLDGVEATAQRLGPDDPETWGALSTVYAKRPALLAELAVLENGDAPDLIQFLSDRQEARDRVIECVLMRGGLWDSRRNFVVVEG
jgi:hypothetical protein